MALILAHPNAVTNEPSAQLEVVLRRVMADEQRLLEIEPLLRQRLRARGMSEDNYRSVVGLLLDRIAKDRALARSDLGGDMKVLAAAVALGGEAPNLDHLMATVTPPGPQLARRQTLLEILGMELAPAQFGEAVERVREELARCGAEGQAEAVMELAGGLAREADPVKGRGPTLRAMASDALRRGGTEEVVRCLTGDFTAQPKEGKLRRVDLLGQMGEVSADALLEIAGDAHPPQVVAQALKAAARTGITRSHVPHAVRALSSQRASEIVAALAATGGEGTVSAIGLFMGHRDTAVRRQALQMLGEVPGPASQEILLKAMFDAAPQLRAAAADSLGRIGARGAVLALSMAATQGPLVGKGYEVRKAAVRALGQIGTVECAAPLVKVLHTGSLLFKNHSDELRALAAQGLGRIPSDEARQALLGAVRDRRKAVSALSRQVLRRRARRAAQAQAGGTP